MNFLLVLSLIASLKLFIFIRGVTGHGFVHSVKVGGQDLPGWNPFVDSYANPQPERAIRKIKDDGPVPGDSNDMNCGIGGDSATSMVADVAAGSQVTFEWEYWPADHQGPVSTYMASCDGDCTGFSANNAKWFKLDAGGYDPETKQWAADQLRANGNTWTSNIPSQLKPGQYLVRHEIVALHSQAPQFYPSCIQVRVTGSGTGTPSDSDLVSIPALYTGVKWPFIYGDFGAFTIPGPPPVTFGGDNNGPPATESYSSSSAPTATTESAPTASAPTTTNVESRGQQPSETSTSALPATTGQCRLRRRFARSQEFIYGKALMTTDV
ncbi:hypothetical protein AGABI1DRAFT_71213 [Agaricus bisporus var. burnettii JB137-S8]|uniref:lytic cellulose monooxygenase (C4-dehydrogenating) n=2 Tax=Agaricus bisporus var. burnettii TaxID=192524 RepID=K5XBQ6_AGABU|nr:uncharacterized protein AGABI1DRAFT_71213 [Agaricus bisporus var. burnettii JB137-S8]EKM80723.1 hypothetical protein AGABI1DRAFT_71213 [Agaricus bisporus var. burnettii JB137-S8]KAF7782350.1 CAZyme family AA9 [Agaricus bisporus var. burnettii]